MAAFNYVVAELECPSCRSAAIFELQTHVASDYEGDERGRFMNRYYQLGERMLWFGPEHPDFDTWDPFGGHGQTVHEWCPGQCSACKASIECRVVFVDVTPLRLSDARLRD